jgi:hypothetical protein
LRRARDFVKSFLRPLIKVFTSFKADICLTFSPTRSRRWFIHQIWSKSSLSDSFSLSYPAKLLKRPRAFQHI